MQARGSEPGRPVSGELAGVATEHGRIVRRTASDKGNPVERFGHDGPHPVTNLGGRIDDALQHLGLLVHLASHELAGHRAPTSRGCASVTTPASVITAASSQVAFTLSKPARRLRESERS